MFEETDNYLEFRERQTSADSQSTAEVAIRIMRLKLGRSSLASHYDKLSKANKMLLLNCAGINADLLWDYRFEQFNRSQRNEIRHAIIEINNLAHVFDGINLSKDQCRIPSKTISRASNVPQRVNKFSSG